MAVWKVPYCKMWKGAQPASDDWHTGLPNSALRPPQAFPVPFAPQEQGRGCLVRKDTQREKLLSKDKLVEVWFVFQRRLMLSHSRPSSKGFVAVNSLHSHGPLWRRPALLSSAPSPQGRKTGWRVVPLVTQKVGSLATHRSLATRAMLQVTMQPCLLMPQNDVWCLSAQNKAQQRASRLIQFPCAPAAPVGPI